MRGKAIPAETRAAIAADLSSGDSKKTVAARYGVSEASVEKYSPTSRRGRVYVDKIVHVNQLGPLFLEVVAHNLAALRNVTDLTHDRTWLKAQDAPGLAILYGVLFDKTGKIAGAALAGLDVAGRGLGGHPTLEAADDAAPAAAPPGTTEG